MEEKRITVIGSCVCRDLFEKVSDNYSFHTDIRFSSPISMLAKPLGFVKADFDSFIKDVPTVNGKWYKKNLINDINKTAFAALEDRHGDYLVLDFAESRIPLAEISWPNKSETLLVTNSVSFRAHYNASFNRNILKGTKLSIHNPLQYSDEEWKQAVEEFANRILKLFKEEKIILIKNMPARYFVNSKGALRPYYSKDHFDSVMLCDLLLNKLNKYFLDVCPKCNVIEIPPYAIGSQKHKWGNHPFHFREAYYDYLFKCVDLITNDGNKGELSNIYNEYSAIFKKEYDEAVKAAALEGNNDGSFGVDTLLKEYEEYNHLGRKQKALILFALDKKHFFKNFKRMKKELNNK